MGLYDADNSQLTRHYCHINAIATRHCERSEAQSVAIQKDYLWGGFMLCCFVPRNDVQILFDMTLPVILPMKTPYYYWCISFFFTIFLQRETLRIKTPGYAKGTTG